LDERRFSVYFFFLLPFLLPFLLLLDYSNY